MENIEKKISTKEVQKESQENEISEFNPETALKEEKSLLDKIGGKTRKLAGILMLTSALIAGEGIMSQAQAQEKEAMRITQVEEEKKVDSETSQFMELEKNEQVGYLENLAKKAPEYKETSEIIDGNDYITKELVSESGMKQIIELKENLDGLYERETDSLEKEKINQSFLAVHRFVLEYGINWFGKQELWIYNNEGIMEIGQFINRVEQNKQMYDPQEVNEFLEKGEPGKLLTEFMKEVKKTVKKSDTELSKIKQIHDLVAYHIPRYKWYQGEGETGSHGYQSFEQLLKNQAGICTEKNALLVYALRQNGIDAYLGFTETHIFTRVFTSEGVLDIDITSSEPFNLSKLRTKGKYCYSTDRGTISIVLDSDEQINRVAQRRGVPSQEIKGVLDEISGVNPHPLYNLGELTPASCGKYSKDLFKEEIKYE